jgi:hypothetical protein
VASRSLTQAQAVLADRHDTGPARVRALRELATIASAADHSLAGVRSGPGHLVEPFAGVHRRFRDRLVRLRRGLVRGAAGAVAGADLLEGPRRYLVVAANNAEMRAGEGMFLSAGVLETGGGTLDVSPFRPTPDLGLSPGKVSLEGDLADRWGWLRPNEEWRNLGVSPRFDVTAPLAARMWESTGGGPVDGVLAVDPAALRAVLQAVGPVEVDGTRVEAKTVEDFVLHGQYVEHAAEDDPTARREALGNIARAVVGALQDRGWDGSVLGRGLGEAARGRHILAWSARPAEQAGWVAAGIDGSLTADSLLVGILNRGANKLDRFLDVNARLEVHGGTGVLRQRLRNTVPPGEPAYVAGPGPSTGVGEGVYAGMVAVSLPGDARNGRFDGVGALAVAGADGPTRAVAMAVTVARGEQRSLTLRFDLPPSRRQLRVEPSARLPAIDWSGGGRRWRDTSARTVRW